MHQRVPVLKLLNFERHKGATGFCGVKESESCLVVLVLFGCEFVQLVNHLLNGSGHLLLKSLLDPGLHFYFGSHLLVENSKCDVLEVSYCASFIVVKHILCHDVNQQNIFLVDVLLVFLDPLGESHFLLPSQTKEVVFIIFDEHTVYLAILKLLQSLT